MLETTAVRQILTEEVDEFKIKWKERPISGALFYFFGELYFQVQRFENKKRSSYESVV